LRLHVHGVSQRALRQADRLHEFLDQDFANRRRFTFCHRHGLPHSVSPFSLSLWIFDEPSLSRSYWKSP
jgi:hypothetical protein